LRSSRRQHALDSFLGHAHLLSDQQHHCLQANEALPQGLELSGAGSAARGPVPFPPEGRRAADFNQLLLPLLPPGTPPLRVLPRENAKPADVSAGEPGFTTEALARIQAVNPRCSTWQNGLYAVTGAAGRSLCSAKAYTPTNAPTSPMSSPRDGSPEDCPTRKGNNPIDQDMISSKHIDP